MNKQFSHKLTITNYPFSQEGKAKISKTENGINWPAVYLLHNNTNIYIGETQSLENRIGQHLDNVLKRNKYTDIEAIVDTSLNKSAILDIEQCLIQYMSADGKYVLDNGNGGQSVYHQYYNKEYYHNVLFPLVWEELKRRAIVDNTLDFIKNTDIFKYSPYTSLTESQRLVSLDVSRHIYKTLEKDKTGTFVVNGCAGTGKTVLAITIINFLSNLVVTKNRNLTANIQNMNEDAESIYQVLLKQKFAEKNICKIGFVVPMESLRTTLKAVFSKLKFKNVKIIKPSDVINEKFDIVLVDEAHRLKRRKALRSYAAFDEQCKKLNLDPLVASELDMIQLRSRYTILFYDPDQTVKAQDITEKQFKNALKLHNLIETRKLESQLRVAGGNDYIEYIDAIFSSSKNPIIKQTFNNYEFTYFDHIKDMYEEIKIRESKCGLSRMMAGISWEWDKNLSYEYIKNHRLEKIEIEGQKFIWNTTDKRWIISKNAINEIGCIHTTQGYDLNYGAIIFGKEIDYDWNKKTFVINKKLFLDAKAKENSTEKEIKAYVINAYKVMLKRGIKGTFVYAMNDGLKKYLKLYIGQFKNN